MSPTPIKRRFSLTISIVTAAPRNHRGLSIDSGADGIRTDKKGNLYLASHGVQVYSPQGKLLGKIQPPQNPRNIAFGDSDFRTLYMIGNTLYRVRLDIPGAVQY